MTLITCSRCLNQVPVAVSMYTEVPGYFRLAEEKWCVECFQQYCKYQSQKQMQREMK